MADIITPQTDYEAIARKAYEWLKMRRAKREISIIEVVMKVTGLRRKDFDDVEKTYEFFWQSGEALLSLIEKENEYVADFSTYKDKYVGEFYGVPFVFRKK